MKLRFAIFLAVASITSQGGFALALPNESETIDRIAKEIVRRLPKQLLDAQQKLVELRKTKSSLDHAKIDSLATIQAMSKSRNTLFRSVADRDKKLDKCNLEIDRAEKLINGIQTGADIPVASLESGAKTGEFGAIDGKVFKVLDKYTLLADVKGHKLLVTEFPSTDDLIAGSKLTSIPVVVVESGTVTVVNWNKILDRVRAFR